MPVTRRRFLEWLAAGGVGALAGASGVRLADGSSIEPSTASSADRVIAFRGPHQAGIATPRQTHVVFASIDTHDISRDELRALLRFWTQAADRMTHGALAAPSGALTNVPWDTGEAVGLGPNRLTITFGVGPGLFDKDGQDRFGLASSRPDALVTIPGFKTDRLDPSLSHGDLCIQACADDAQVAFHAVRELVRLGHGLVSLRWSQSGFVPAVPKGVTPRNLLGFKDGTGNIRGEDVQTLERFVWVGAEGPSWLRGGSYLVVRRIDFLVNEWDGASLAEQEAVIGRRKVSGAPLTGLHEFDRVDLEAIDVGGFPSIPSDAHVRVAAPSANGGVRILRRSYSFVDRGESHLRVGLLFIAYQRDPRVQFIPMQRALARTDALNQYIRPTGSAIFAVFPGVEPGEVLGRELL
jgi:deferrochelatase/peroxidase EfeB